MVMAGEEYRNEVPLKNVYFTGIVRDKLGRKMSKSLGNSPDPIELMNKYGADGVRVGMLLTAPAGNDLPFDEALCEQGRNFSNKIWNALRLVKGWEIKDMEQPQINKMAINWFENHLAATLTEIEDCFNKYRLSEALMATYKLVWDDFCSWYLEIVKPAYQQPLDKATYEATIGIFEKLMCMLHPFMPFITEEIWHTLRERNDGESIMLASMPKSANYDTELLKRFATAKETIIGLRGLRNSKGMSPKEVLELYIKKTADDTTFDAMIAKLCNLSKIEYVAEKVESALSFMVGAVECYVPFSQNIDKDAELKKLEDELAYTQGFLQSVLKKLSNERFVNGAPEKVVAMERKKQSDAEQKIKALEEQIKALKG
jgi:valyl-tRNA synthetase